MTGEAVIFGGLFRLAPIARHAEIVWLVGASVFERDDMLKRPPITRKQRSAAPMALAATGSEYRRPFLSRECFALDVVERVHSRCFPK